MRWRQEGRVHLLAAVVAGFLASACTSLPLGGDGAQRGPQAAAAGAPGEAPTQVAAAHPDPGEAEAGARAALSIEEAIAALDPAARPRGLTVTLAGVFAGGTATLRPDAEADVEALAALLRRHSDREVLIEGHTDDRGDAMVNLHLSLERAGAVKSALVAEGIAPGRLRVSGRGEREPIADNDTEEGRRRNRRVEVIVLDAGGADVVAPNVASGP